MFATSEDVIRWIHEQKSLGIKPGLKRMQWMMERLDYPERRLRTIHIGGTNGKGSTTAFLRSILQEAGFEVGTFTSPYIETFHERISVNGQPIQDEDLVKAATVIKPLADELKDSSLGAPTEFELITAICFYYFANIHPVDFVLVEVGLGGRLDSTNIIHPLLSIITNIGYDHMHILGSTIDQIAREKAGIIKNGVPVITASLNEQAKKIIEEKAKEKKSKLYEFGNHFRADNIQKGNFQEQFTVTTLFHQYESLAISLLGTHQIRNASVAVMAAELLNTYYSFVIEKEAIYNGLKKATWPGRFEILSKNPAIVLDGAHNKEGLESLILTAKRHFPDKKGTVLFTALHDKPLEMMVQQLDRTDYHIVFTQFSFPRASKVDDLYRISNSTRKELAPDWQQYLEQKIRTLHNDELLIVTGSLYFISEVKAFLSNKEIRPFALNESRN
ncbi:bifunctional folylpolyglutamate synthase/dihydrofolate synthase [Fervidibacillus halotolerans]|uniref:Dihydrofolate synthase/folylpolyglutamate synthase n=1 Tax=Fervidibacillus halotolerans TaxID=2980027 RepID=A0A9E8LXP3_9BACI|nr:folylpolyglutamate synthase/dihydrofolate synthase family protein [Fervidibacillus halotolerans]WAA11590.1 bifunctional folylpolyglutamate synthase/dihydrofolate synthase [Fervidibacillus halotolerans]